MLNRFRFTFLVMALAVSGLAFAQQATASEARTTIATSAMKVISVKVRYADIAEPQVPFPASTITALPGMGTTVSCPGPGGCVLKVDATLQVSMAPGFNGAFCVEVDGNLVGGCPNAEYWDTANFRNLVDRRFIKITAGNHAVVANVWGGSAGTVASRSVEYTVYKKK